ncbi:farnesyl pyrophosphate synthase [Solenopsis invicta]|uniref:farnesyl pyrophosphate synthase n=1 Tax=Solenopsis invicta TaxID=13686 RepID=UPI0005960E2D|nr:farnesyl pyrophosphate synthase [Solenopsis invicta]XP_039306543.1 farnesyl pyrophosphate synthase [Solenopsis invicta]XP_039306544.1 farnesyl pyrophosphate synthase [Solenopsis invicta]
MWETTEEEIREMMAVWPEIVREIMEHVKNIPNIGKWLEKVLQYNVTGTTKLHGLIVIYAYKSITPNEQQTEDNIRLASILAWCMEMAISYLIIIDDILDQSLFRRGQPCWYRHDDIGLMAINDALLLESIVYFLIRKHFKGKECYDNLVETFQQDIVFKTLIGQFLDMSLTYKKSNLDQFTMNRYNSIAKWKEYGSLFVPTVLAMHFAGIKDSEMFKQSETILSELIVPLYQIQDDYLGCFGDFEVLGKDSTDIEEGKCTWLIVKALERVTPEQRKILEECYGVSDPEKVKRVKQLYIDLDLQNAFFKYEEEMYNIIKAQIQQISCENQQRFLMGLLGKLHGRQVCDF